MKVAKKIELKDLDPKKEVFNSPKNQKDKKEILNKSKKTIIN